MFGVRAAVKALIIASYEPQKIALITVGGDGGVVTPGKLHRLVIFDPVCFIRSAVDDKAGFPLIGLLTQQFQAALSDLAQMGIALLGM